MYIIASMGKQSTNSSYAQTQTYLCSSHTPHLAWPLPREPSPPAHALPSRVGPRTTAAQLGDILDLGEPEGHAKASEEHGDERAGVVEGREVEFPAVGVHPAR